MKEGKTRRRAASRVAIVGGVLITAAAIALYTPWLGLFGLREIAVSGNRRVSAEAIARAANLRRGMSLFAIRSSYVSSNVASLPWIRDVTVRREFPHRLSIQVLERAAVAWIHPPSDGPCLTIAEGGVIAAEGCDENQEGLLELIGASVSGEVPGAVLVDVRVSELVDAVHALALSDTHFHRIDVSDPSSIVLDAESGLRVLLGAIDTHARRIEQLVALSRRIDLEAYRQIDLRLEGEATLVTW